jgi:hypothetical protein
MRVNDAAGIICLSLVGGRAVGCRPKVGDADEEIMLSWKGDGWSGRDGAADNDAAHTARAGNEELMESLDNGVGCSGVAVILRTGAGLLEAVLERVVGVEGKPEGSKQHASEEVASGHVRTKSETNAHTMFEADDVAAVHSLVAGLTAGAYTRPLLSST